MSRTSVLTCFLLLWALLASLFAGAQEPWPREKGHGTAGIWASYQGYGSILGPNRENIRLRRKLNDVAFGLVADFGLTDRLTFSFLLPLRYVSTGSGLQEATYFNDTLPNGTLFGAQTVMLGANYAMVEKKFGLSIFLNAEGNVASLDSATMLSTGPRTFVLYPGIRLGYRTEKVKVAVEMGYRYRTKSWSGDFSGRFMVDYSWNSKTHIFVSVDGIYNLTKGDPALNFSSTDSLGVEREWALHTGTAMNNAQFAEFGIKLAHQFGRFMPWVNVAARYGRRVPTGPQIGLGLIVVW